MSKLNRKFDEAKMHQSKERTMEVVMSTINQKKQPFFRLNKTLLPLLAFALIMSLIFVLGGSNNPPTIIDDPTYEYSDESIEILADISYISSGLMLNELTVYTPSTNQLFLASYQTSTFMSNDTETEFEGNLDQFNHYFDMLRVYLEDTTYQESPLVEAIDHETYNYVIRYNVDGLLHEFYLSIDNDVITGELHLNGDVFTITGDIKEEEEELEISIMARDNGNYVELEYKKEIGFENERKYEIKSSINGVESEKEFKISTEENEQKVEISENEAEYELKKEVINGLITYKLEYEVNGKDGEVTITETTDSNGNKVYQYHIEEDGVEKDIEKEGRGRRNNDDEDDDEYEDQSSPTKSSEHLITV